MKKVYVLTGDCHHDDNINEACLRLVFGNDMIFTSDPTVIPWEDMENQVSVYVSMKETNTTQNEEGILIDWITREREEALYRFVEKGGGALFIHCGLVGYPTDSLYHKVSGGVFVDHPSITEIQYVPIKKDHPIMKEVESFGGHDEKYFCHIDMTEVEVFLGGDDPKHPGSIAGWCKEIGKGRTVSVTPGHTYEVVENNNMTQMLKNAVKWLMKG